MPPVEAMLLGATVVTTKCASIPEITQNKANYVEDPFDEREWVEDVYKRQGNILDAEISNMKKECLRCGEKHSDRTTHEKNVE